MALGRVVGLIVVRAVGVDGAASARAAVGGQEMGRNAVEHGTERGVACLAQLGHAPDLAHEQLVARVPDGAVFEKARETSRRRAEHRLQPVDARRHTRPAVRSGGPLREEPVERGPRHEAPLEQRRQALPRPRDAELREHQRDVGVGSRLAGQDPQRLIERVFDEARHLRLVRQVEAGIEIGFERELPQQREAERVNRADRDVAQPVAELDPSGSIELGSGRRLAELAHDPLAHFGRGLPRERDREDVGRIDAALEQVDVARDEDRGLAGAGRGLEHDVVVGLDREAARARVGVGRDAAGIVGQQRRLARPRRPAPRARPAGRRRATAETREAGYSSPT